MAAKGKTVAKTEEPAGTGIAEVKEKQVVPGIAVADSELAAEMQGVAGAGVSDNVDDRGVPLLYICQKGSPQIDKKKVEKYVDGMEVGNVFNSITNTHWDSENDGLVLLPCFFRMNWNQWTPRDDGGGFHGSHPRDTPLLNSAKMFVDPKTEKVRRDIYEMPNGDLLKLTAHYYCIIEDSWSPIIVPMASTNLTPSRKLQTLLSDQKIQVNGSIVMKPGYFSRVLLKTVYRDDGDNQWYQFAAEIEGPNENRALREFCKAFAVSCQRNEVKMATPVDGSAGTGTADDNIPV